MHHDDLDYTGPRNLNPDHVRALIDHQRRQPEAHIQDWEDHMMAKELEDAEQRVWEAREEEDARAYLKQQPCYDDKDYR